MRRRLEQFMQGRYGTDELTKFLMAICLILLLANIFTRQPLLYWLALVLIGYCYFRMFSRNISGRNEENQKYLSWTAGIRRSFTQTKNRIVQRVRTTIFTNVRPADRRSASREEKEKSVSPVRSAGMSLKSEADHER